MLLKVSFTKVSLNFNAFSAEDPSIALSVGANGSNSGLAGTSRASSSEPAATSNQGVMMSMISVASSVCCVRIDFQVAMRFSRSWALIFVEKSTPCKTNNLIFFRAPQVSRNRCHFEKEPYKRRGLPYGRVRRHLHPSSQSPGPSPASPDTHMPISSGAQASNHEERE